MALNLLGRKRKAQQHTGTPGSVPNNKNPSARPPHDDDGFVAAPMVAMMGDDLGRMLQLGRFGAIVTDPNQWNTHPKIHDAFRRANEAIDEAFGLVPEGYAALPQTIQDTPGSPELDLETQPFLLARHTVTNAQYQNFVDGGGYQEVDLWPREIWPHLIDFTDLTDHPGPRFWRGGRHDRRLSDHPVVGICYYEAAAYARWTGYRLPTEAEWQMAASWRIRSSANVLRRYPWGDALDRQKCNIWTAGRGTTAPVTAYEEGAAPNGVLQLIGNVWEWTCSDFEVTDEQGRPVVGDMLMISVRGGAFDTYFTAQAASCFRTGLACMVRAHNVGFRCALDIRN